MAVRSFPVPAAPRFKFAVIPVAQQSVVVGIRLDKNISAVPAVTTRRPATRDVLLPAKRDTPVAAIPRFYRNFCFVCEHLFTRDSTTRSNLAEKSYASARTKDKNTRPVDTIKARIPNLNSLNCWRQLPGVPSNDPLRRFPILPQAAR